MFNYRHPSPRYEYSGVGSCGSCATLGGYGAAGAATGEFREVTFYAQASQTFQIMTETDVHFDPKSSQAPLGSPRWPNGAHRHPKEAKGKPK